MESFTFSYENTNIDFNKYVAREIYRKTYGKIKIKNSKGLNIDRELYKNIFYDNDYEINISRISLYDYEVDIYPLIKSNKFKFVFGCELETCILTNCLDENLSNELNNIKSLDFNFSNAIEFTKEIWLKLIKNFIQQLNPSAEFASKFPKAQIVLEPKSGFVDVEYDFYTRSFTHTEEIINHEHLIFTRDSSLFCGDTLHIKKSEKSKIKVDFNKLIDESFHCEIVTPILYNEKDINLIYETLLISECMKGNESTSFHINVSMLTEYGTPIYWSQGFIDCFLDYFEEYEYENYNKFRPNGSWYAKELLQYSKNFTFDKIQSILDSDTRKYINDNFIKGENFYRCFIDLYEKYNSFHIKNPIIGEFRLFPSAENSDILLEYVKDTYKIIKKTILDYHKTYKTLISDLQEKYSKIKIDYDDVKYYKYFLYYEDKDCNIVKLDKPKENIKNLVVSLKNLFHSRGQEFIEIKDGTITTLNNIGDEKFFYKINFLRNDIVEIILD